MRRVFAILGLIGLSVLPAGSAQRLTLTLSPAVSFAPATVRIRARVEPSADNRLLTVVADSPNFYRSSEVQLDGEEAPKTFELSFRDVPAGDYEVWAILSTTSARSRVTAHSALSILAR